MGIERRPPKPSSSTTTTSMTTTPRSKTKSHRPSSRTFTTLLLTSTLLLLTLTTTPTPTSAAATKQKQKIDTRRYANVCIQQTKSYTAVPEKDGRGHAILKMVIEHSSPASILSYDTPQHKAMCYMLFDDPRKVDPRGMVPGLGAGAKGRFMDRYALVTLYINTKGPGWTKSDHWLTGEDECKWYGITCSTAVVGSKRITGIDLSFNKITGIMPRELAYITELEALDLNGNSLQGVIPYLMLSNLKKLSKLHLHMNDLFGNIPREIGDLKNLKELTLFGNFFFGKLPNEITNLKKLEILDIYANNLTGTIMTEIGKMKNLREVYVNDNEFVGSIPKEVCKNKISHLQADCLGNNPEVRCDCCTVCCKGLPTPTCRDVRPGAGVAKKKKK